MDRSIDARTVQAPEQHQCFHPDRSDKSRCYPSIGCSWCVDCWLPVGGAEQMTLLIRNTFLAYMQQGYLISGLKFNRARKKVMQTVWFV